MYPYFYHCSLIEGVGIAANPEVTASEQPDIGLNFMKGAIVFVVIALFMGLFLLQQHRKCRSLCSLRAARARDEQEEDGEEDVQKQGIAPPPYEEALSYPAPVRCHTVTLSPHGNDSCSTAPPAYETLPSQMVTVSTVVNSSQPNDSQTNRHTVAGEHWITILQSTNLTLPSRSESQTDF